MSNIKNITSNLDEIKGQEYKSEDTIDNIKKVSNKKVVRDDKNLSKKDKSMRK